MSQLRILLSFLLLVPVLVSASGGHGFPLQHAKVNLHDKLSLQRGAKMYMNYCSGCHALKYLRYNRMATDLGLNTHDGMLDRDLLVNNLIFTSARPLEPITIAMPPEDSREWFGTVPPDLSLIARVRGADWLFTYLTSFYRDDSRPFGVNNAVLPDAAMPNVFANLQGEQVAQWRTDLVPYNGSKKEVRVIDHLQTITNGDMSEQQFDQSINDLVTFLVYVGEPIQTTRMLYGYWIIAFLLAFMFVVYLLKKEYWRDVKKR